MGYNQFIQEALNRSAAEAKEQCICVNRNALRLNIIFHLWNQFKNEVPWMNDVVYVFSGNVLQLNQLWEDMMHQRDYMIDNELVPIGASFCDNVDCVKCPDSFGELCETRWHFYDFSTHADMLNRLQELINSDRAYIEHFTF